MKQLVIRFDVDTHKCVKQGIPNLIAIGRKHNVKFTFFVNFGRAVSQKDYIFEILKKSKSVKKHTHLSAFTKLGFKDYLVAAFLNPQIGSIGSKSILSAIKNGHEIGLHGGRNHEVWNREALHWGRKRIEAEITWGIHEMSKIKPKYKMISFASPHWKGNDRIYSVLRRKEFAYVSDIHTNKPLQKIDTKKSLPNIPNNISGEPMGVGYIEWCRANKMSDDQILNDFSKQLFKRKKFATLYDHPYYAGVSEIDLLEKMIVLAKEKNFKIVTLSKIYKLI